MKMPQKPISSIDYINGLVFDYIETYSFRNGKQYEENIKNLGPEYATDQYSISAKGEFNPTRRTKTFKMGRYGSKPPFGNSEH